jgi:hypothetical protein
VEDRERSARSLTAPAVDFAALTPTRLARLARTPRALSKLLHDDNRQLATRRPAPAAWCAAEVVCHLRDIEEAYFDRIRCILLNDRPALIQLDPERWVDDRQYRRCDLAESLAAFGARREDTLRFLDSLAPDQWERGADHPARGHVTVRRVVHSLAGHDVEHLNQIARALAGAT